MSEKRFEPGDPPDNPTPAEERMREEHEADFNKYPDIEDFDVEEVGEAVLEWLDAMPHRERINALNNIGCADLVDKAREGYVERQMKEE